MKKLKIDLRKLNVPEKIQKARTIVSRMDGNTFFTSPNPSLADITAAADALENAYEDAQDGSKPKKVLLQRSEVELEDLLTNLGAYVQNISAGDEHIILTSGFEVKHESSAPIAPRAPVGLRGQANGHYGEVSLRWEPVVGAKSYIAEMSLDGTNWTSCGVSTRAKLIVSNLVSGSKPFFRIAAVGSQGPSGWSTPGSVRVD